MSIMKKILIALLVAFVVIQFIRPHRNISSLASSDITTIYNVPDTVQSLLQTACYDCHSNNTRYPWYTNIQPVGWWMQHHVDEGKREINFSEFASYSLKKQAHKMKEVQGTVKNGAMPLPSYLWIHSEAKLSDQQKALIIEWAKGVKEKTGIVDEGR